LVYCWDARMVGLMVFDLVPRMVYCWAAMMVGLMVFDLVPRMVGLKDSSVAMLANCWVV
jgi:hypothetical protein